jgi:zinc/manganese transport system substrate-binding protein
MKTLLAAAAALGFALAALMPVRASEPKILVVAAENFYGDVAQQVGGDRVSVASVLSNPDQDPHLFEITPAVARQIAAAQVIIYNGAAYDPWMENVLRVTPRAGRALIVAADLMHRKAGDNPHLWYDPSTMPAVAAAIADALSAADPAHKDEYAARLKAFLDSLTALNKEIATIRNRYAGTPVAASEPVFGYMAAALRLKMREGQFQAAVMNDTEPAASALALFEDDLKMRKVRTLFYNKQASNNLVQRLVQIARVSDIPVVGVTETSPPGLSYQDWMMNELSATERALAGPNS